MRILYLGSTATENLPTSSVVWWPLFHTRDRSGFCCVLLEQLFHAILVDAVFIIMGQSFGPSFDKTHPAKLFLGIVYVVPL